MGKATGFMEIKRKTASEREPLERMKDWKEYAGSFLTIQQENKGHAAWIAVFPFVILVWK